MTERVLVTRLPVGGRSSPAIERISSRHPMWVWDENRPLPHELLASEIETATGLYSMLTDRIDAELLSKAPHLRVISQMAVGVNNIDLAACEERGIRVGHTPDVLTETTADLAFGLIIAGARRFDEAINDVKEGRWGDWDPAYLVGHDVHGSTLGIIGFGRIGRAIARRAKGFSMRVIYHQRSDAQLTDATYVSLEQLLSESDHVVLATPLNDDTHHIISTAELARMKPNATLVNIGRGPLVDPVALAAALETGQIASAALDVTEPEPISATDPLVRLPNCLILPHIGSSSLATRQAMAELATDNLIAGLAGSVMPAEVVP